MNGTQVPLQLLTVFVAVAEHASFSKASRKLGVGKGTVSRSIAQLEDLLGTELIHRTNRSVALSTAGTALFERTGPHVQALQRAVVDLPERDETPSGVLRIAAPMDVGIFVLEPMVAAFARRYPAVRFDIRLMAGRTDLVKEGYDLALRVATGPIKDPSLTVRKLGTLPAAFYAAPSYLARRGRPRAVGDDRHTWVMRDVALRLLHLRHDAAQIVVDDFLLARDLIRDGMGVGPLPTFAARPYEEEGLLEPLTLQGLGPMAADLVMVYPSSRQTAKKVTAFRDFAVEACRRSLR